ncbi:MAG: Rieske 2Fe-2S domain-containing protein [Pleurocapsa minor GSE-CHR-MK-17-07R]|jgi:cytochrome b6-f complex iron-sulfur subunit|nr:Rieske 2Fe-2S domain-containing protein [Pleurocapsa minor GSE-CHR-MK 17-07R]
MATIAAENKATVQAKAEPQVQVAAPSRREFLYYIWGASLVMVLGEAAVAFIWFALPRFKEGTFGGIFDFPVNKVPLNNDAPYNEASGRFWVTHYDGKLAILYGICTHLGCLPKWVPNNDRFECPCHGSKFERSGRFIEGPAPRSLDRFPIVVQFSDGTTASTSAEGGAVDISGREVVSIRIDTGRKLTMPGHQLPAEG